jgi:predicted amidophosphoribosyltransferase
MALPENIVINPICPHCGATAHLASARFCSHCGTGLIDRASAMAGWQRPTPARYSHIVMSRIALSCPDCGEPMRFGFRKICRRCGAALVMIPRLLHPNHFRVYVGGPRAALAGLMVEGFWFAILLAVLCVISRLIR